MSERVYLFGAHMDVMTRRQATQTVLDWTMAEPTSCRFVVTPNVDHTVMLRDLGGLREVYDAAHLVLADGWPVVAASRLLGKALPERVAGSDLVPHLFSSSPQELTVFLLGAMPGVAQRASENIHKQWKHVKVVGTCSPPLGFEKNDRENDSILAQIEAVRPDLLVVGLGAPKQEQWVYRHHERIAAKVALCVGATIDFLAGEKRRAPRWMRCTGLEWLHRCAREPRRLARRYAVDAWVFPQLVWQEWRASAGC
jgi:N-acetylglucosaminyldiphosphoundecaprenol N-acetyl-beta-D-mannosaminyltransferase